MPYKFLEDVALADIAIEATGKTLDELFEAAAMAVAEQTVDIKTLGEKRVMNFGVTAKDIPHLLYDFLSELLYLKDAESLLYKTIKVTVTENPCTAHASIKGDTINPEKHELRNDIKAITLHMFEVKREGKGWMARFVVDI